MSPRLLCKCRPQGRQSSLRPPRLTLVDASGHVSGRRAEEDVEDEDGGHHRTAVRRREETEAGEHCSEEQVNVLNVVDACVGVPRFATVRSFIISNIHCNTVFLDTAIATQFRGKQALFPQCFN